MEYQKNSKVVKVEFKDVTKHVNFYHNTTNVMKNHKFKKKMLRLFN